MADYKSSLQQGLDAAKQAQQNRAEVDAVFADLNAQIGESFDQKFEIIRSHKNVQSENNTIGTLANLANLFSQPTKRVSILAARSKGDQKFMKELAKWNQEPYGYPCKIISAEDEIYCENRQALESGLALLLRSASTGEQILMVLNHIPESQ